MSLLGCSAKLPFCKSNPCQNGGTCRVSWETYSCDCPVGFGGKDCNLGETHIVIQNKHNTWNISLLIFKRILNQNASVKQELLVNVNDVMTSLMMLLLECFFHSDVPPPSFPWKQCAVVGSKEWSHHHYTLVHGAGVPHQIKRGSSPAGSSWTKHQLDFSGIHTYAHWEDKTQKKV